MESYQSISDLQKSIPMKERLLYVPMKENPRSLMYDTKNLYKIKSKNYYI